MTTYVFALIAGGMACVFFTGCCKKFGEFLIGRGGAYSYNFAEVLGIIFGGFFSAATFMMSMTYLFIHGAGR